MTSFFQAWRRRQASRQAAEWDEERAAARLAVADVPEEIVTMSAVRSRP